VTPGTVYWTTPINLITAGILLLPPPALRGVVRDVQLAHDILLCVHDIGHTAYYPH